MVCCKSFTCLPHFSKDAQRLLSHAVQVATACASTLRAEFAAVDRPGLTALQQLVGVAWSGLADLCDGFWEFLACISVRMATLWCNVVLCQKYKAKEHFVMSKSGTGTGLVRQRARIWRTFSVALGCGNVCTSSFFVKTSWSPHQSTMST